MSESCLYQAFNPSVKNHILLHVPFPVEDLSTFPKGDISRRNLSTPVAQGYGYETRADIVAWAAAFTMCSSMTEESHPLFIRNQGWQVVPLWMWFHPLPNLVVPGGCWTWHRIFIPWPSQEARSISPRWFLLAKTIPQSKSHSQSPSKFAKNHVFTNILVQHSSKSWFHQHFCCFNHTTLW